MSRRTTRSSTTDRLAGRAAVYAAAVAERPARAHAAAAAPAAPAAEDQAPEAPDTAEAAVRWEGPVGFEGQFTGDGRFIEPGALRWENLPLPFRYTPIDNGEHQGAVVIGNIDTLERRNGGVIWGAGAIDTASEYGPEAARVIRDGFVRGVSMDLDDVSFEIRVAKDLLEEEPVEEGETVAEAPDTEAETDDEGRVTVVKIEADDEVMASTDARIRAATLVQIPAFAGALISLAEGSEPPEPAPAPAAETGEAGAEPVAASAAGRDEDALCAAAAPLAPPEEWFADPGLSEPTPLTITADGRIYGHLALWGTCHTAYQGQCVTPPESATDYAYFRTGSVRTAEGSDIPVGRITMDTLHASRNASATATLAHYEDTGRAVADVTVGQDAHGVWFAGALRPHLTAEQVRSLRSSPLSGDWRRIGGALELVAALAVNVPGFPVPRPHGLVASGSTVSLVASGMVPPRKVLAPGTPGALSTEDLRWLKHLAAREKRETLAAEAAGLATRVKRARVDAMARRLNR